MKTALALVVVVVVMVGLSIGGFAYGKHTGFSSGYKRGQAVAKANATEPNYDLEYKGLFYDKLESDYNTLVDDYNNLRNSAVRYVNVTQYQPRTPIHCSTTYYDMLNTANTNCY